MWCERGFSRLILRGGLAVTTLMGVPRAGAQAGYREPESNPSEAPKTRYANMPDAAVPYGKFAKPYKEWFVTDDTLAYYGAARERDSKELADSPTVNIGFLGPLQNNPESRYGLAMLRGAQLAVEEANAEGGYQPGGAAPAKPYVLKVHQDSAQWGASSTEAVKMLFDERVAAVLGAVDGASTHIMLRVSLKLEFPDNRHGDHRPHGNRDAHSLADSQFSRRPATRICDRTSGLLGTQAETNWNHPHAVALCAGWRGKIFR